MYSQAQRFQDKKTIIPATGLNLNSSFLAYLERFHLSLFEVAHASEVRLPTVWRITHSLPISTRHAQRVRKGLYKLTGILYNGPVDVLSSKG